MTKEIKIFKGNIDKVLSYIASKPNGTIKYHIELGTGLNRRTITKAVNKLLEQGKITKDSRFNKRCPLFKIS